MRISYPVLRLSYPIVRVSYPVMRLSYYTMYVSYHVSSRENRLSGIAFIVYQVFLLSAFVFIM